MPSLVVEACSVLGIEPGAKGTPPASDAIQAAFKKLAIKWHPDRNPGIIEEATSRMAEISAARDLLLDPPANALFDEPPAPAASSRPSKAAAALSKGARAFEGDVTEQIDSGELAGKEPAALFETFGLWAVYKCNVCNATCCRLRKNKYSCMCSHRLKDHDAANGFRCSVKGCPCRRFVFQVQDSDQPHKCRCHHAASLHAKVPPYACTLCDCKGFDSPWVCNCGHAAREHSTCFVRHRYTERTRERVEMTAALASGSTARPPLPQPRARALPLLLDGGPSPFEATRQPSSGPPKAEDLRPNPLAGERRQRRGESRVFRDAPGRLSRPIRQGLDRPGARRVDLRRG